MTSERCYYESLVTMSRLSNMQYFYLKIITKANGDLPLLNENDQKIYKTLYINFIKEKHTNKT